MIYNSSVPSNTVMPHVVYQSVEDAIAWLTKTFGFREHFHYGSDPISGAQMHLGNSWVMVRRASNDGAKTPSQLGYGTQSLTVFLEDVEGHYRRAKAAGAKIVEEPHETEYGEFQYGVLDLDGHHWLFARHARDRSPKEWGATVVHATHRYHQLPTPRLCYLEIPAVDVHQSANFYEKVFGWNIRHRESSRPSFDDATGDVSGAWVTGRDISAKPGLLPYIWVSDIHATLQKAAGHGGEVVEKPRPDSPGSTALIATFRDPAGNLIGLYHEPPQ
jgi:predicted enzyme related to lactoylglutathione lyase